MEFSFTEEQVMIADTAKAFFTDNATSERTRAAMAGAGYDPELWQAFAGDLGFAGLALPEEQGGVGLGLVEQAIVAEAAGYRVASLPMLGTVTVGRGIAAGGSAAAQAAHLPGLASGETIAAFAEGDVTEQGGALSGTLRFVPHGDIATLYLVANGGKAWLVEAGAGVSAKKHVTLDQTRPYATVTLSGAKAEALADPAAAVKAAREGGIVTLAAEALGVAQATLDRTVQYSLERVQFGRHIGSFQAYKHRVADMMIEIEQARSAVYWAACAVDSGTDDPEIALSAAKSFCGDTAFYCAAEMIQLHGGIGITWEHDAHLFFKRGRAIKGMLGTSEQHRAKIADMILGETGVSA